MRPIVYGQLEDVRPRAVAVDVPRQVAPRDASEFQVRVEDGRFRRCGPGQE